MRVLGLQAPQKRHKGMIFTTDMAVSWKHNYAPSCLLRSETRAGLAYKNPNDKHTTKKQNMGVCPDCPLHFKIFSYQTRLYSDFKCISNVPKRGFTCLTSK